MYIYYPSCNFSAASPATAKKSKRILKSKCRLPAAAASTRDFPCGYRALHLSGMPRNARRQVKTQSMWEYLDALKDFNFPNLNGQKFYVQDCWRDRNHPEIHEAVRSLLKKMHAEVIEIEHNREKSIFCGNLHYETDDPRLKNYPNTPV